MISKFKPGSIEEAAQRILTEAHPASYVAMRMANKKTGAKYESRYVNLIKSLVKLPWTGKPKKEIEGATAYLIGMIGDKKVTFMWVPPSRYSDYYEFTGADMEYDTDKKSGISFKRKTVGPEVMPVADVDSAKLESEFERNLKDFEAAIAAAKKL